MTLVGLAALFSWPALADDLMPPCWRGRAGSTLQAWSFNNSASPAVPEVMSNPNGFPQAGITLGQGGAGWVNSLSLFGTNGGIWDLGRNGTMALTIPNQSGEAGSWKVIAIQVTQYRDGLYNAMATVSVPGATRVSGQVRTNATMVRGSPPRYSYWVVDQSVWVMETCPATESITITAGVNSSAIDQVVVDTICQEFTCPTNPTVSADIGQCCKTNVTWTMPAADGCLIKSAVGKTNGVIVTSPGTFPVGVTTVTWTVVDVRDNTNTCAQLLTVLDDQNPAIDCPGDITVTNGWGAAGVAVSFQPAFSDNCAVTNVGCVPASGSIFTPGVTTVNCAVWDRGGNSNRCAFTVTVVSDLRVTGQVGLEGYVGPARSGLGSRTVTFIATKVEGSSTCVLATWNQALAFGPDAMGQSVAAYMLTNIPPGTTHLSAKTAWSLRQRVAVTFDGPQATADFLLLSGDISHSNHVGMDDYDRLASAWYQADSAADIDDSGVVDLDDYFLLANRWNEQGDPE